VLTGRSLKELAVLVDPGVALAIKNAVVGFALRYLLDQAMQSNVAMRIKHKVKQQMIRAKNWTSQFLRRK
jgi:hypothetical protein